MNKPPTLIESVDPARSRRSGAAAARTQPEWADAETRGFLGRPVYSSPFVNVLQVILITAMAIAGIKVAWIFFFHA